MNELTLLIDNWGHKELKEYLLNLKGIIEVNINNEKNLQINIKYDSNLIKAKTVEMEILLFLNVLKTPSLLSFDKHTNSITKNYKIVRKDICCEYCFKGAIEELFEIEGIEKATSNFYKEDYNLKDNIIIEINYDPKLLNEEQLQQIEINLNI